MLDYILLLPLCFHNAGLTLTEICVCLRAVYVNYVICDDHTTVSMASLSPLPLILHLLQGHCVISTLSLLQPLLALTLISESLQCFHRATERAEILESSNLVFIAISSSHHAPVVMPWSSHSANTSSYVFARRAWTARRGERRTRCNSSTNTNWSILLTLNVMPVMIEVRRNFSSCFLLFLMSHLRLASTV